MNDELRERINYARNAGYYDKLREWAINMGVETIGRLASDRNIAQGDEVFEYQGTCVVTFHVQRVREWLDTLPWEDDAFIAEVVHDVVTRKSCMILNDFWLECLTIRRQLVI